MGRFRIYLPPPPLPLVHSSAPLLLALLSRWCLLYPLAHPASCGVPSRLHQNRPQDATHFTSVLAPYSWTSMALTSTLLIWLQPAPAFSDPKRIRLFCLGSFVAANSSLLSPQIDSYLFHLPPLHPFHLPPFRPRCQLSSGAALRTCQKAPPDLARLIIMCSGWG